MGDPNINSKSQFNVISCIVLISKYFVGFLGWDRQPCATSIFNQISSLLESINNEGCMCKA